MSKFTNENLSNLTKNELIQICRDESIKNYTGKRKEEIINIIRASITERITNVEQDISNNLNMVDVNDPGYIMRVMPGDEDAFNDFSESDPEGKNFADNIVQHYQGAYVSGLYFRVDEPSKKIIQQHPYVAWKIGVDENHKQYYLHWKYKALIEEAKGIHPSATLTVVVFNEGKSGMLFHMMTTGLETMEELKIEDFFITRLGIESPVLFLNESSSTSQILIMTSNLPKNLSGLAEDNNLSQEIIGFYIKDRRWIQVYMKNRDGKVCYVNFLVDTGSPVTLIVKGTRNLLNPSIKYGTNNGESYHLNICGVRILAYPSEECENLVARNTNLIGTDFLESYVTTDIPARSILTLARIFDSSKICL